MNLLVSCFAIFMAFLTCLLRQFAPDPTLQWRFTKAMEMGSSIHRAAELRSTHPIRPPPEPNSNQSIRWTETQSICKSSFVQGRPPRKLDYDVNLPCTLQQSFALWMIRLAPSDGSFFGVEQICKSYLADCALRPPLGLDFTLSVGCDVRWLIVTLPISNQSLSAVDDCFPHIDFELIRRRHRTQLQREYCTIFLLLRYCHLIDCLRTNPAHNLSIPTSKNTPRAAIVENDLVVEQTMAPAFYCATQQSLVPRVNSNLPSDLKWDMFKYSKRPTCVHQFFERELDHSAWPEVFNSSQYNSCIIISHDIFELSYKSTTWSGPCPSG
jgi:hypothetical protein